MSDAACADEIIPEGDDILCTPLENQYLKAIIPIQVYVKGRVDNAVMCMLGLG